MDILSCPDCKNNVLNMGAIHTNSIFAGNKLFERNKLVSSLYKCKNCQLLFRWPSLDKESLDNLYRSGTSDAWNNSISNRRDWKFASLFIKKNIPIKSSILDVGCYTGDFLSLLNDSYNCNGVEINDQAVEVANSRNINIVARNFADIKDMYNCVTAFDVIEHVESPHLFLKNCLKHVLKGGYLILSTGNSESLSFKLMRSNYWYVVVPEHISFISPSWIKQYSDTDGYHVLGFDLFSHGNRSLIKNTKELLVNMVYKFAPNLFRKFREIGFGRIDTSINEELSTHPPGWGSAKDHFIVYIRKI